MVVRAGGTGGPPGADGVPTCTRPIFARIQVIRRCWRRWPGSTKRVSGMGVSLLRGRGVGRVLGTVYLGECCGAEGLMVVLLVGYF